MPDVTPVAPELSRRVNALARALVAAARAWTLYPPSHPAVRSAVERLAGNLEDACQGERLDIGVTPGSLMVGTVVFDGDGPIAELAGWLHRRDIVHVIFGPPITLSAVQDFLSVLAEDPVGLQKRGGAAAAWAAKGHASIHIEQVDLAHVLRQADGGTPAARKDDLWHSIVRAVLDRRKALDEATQQRLLEVAGDAFAIGDLAHDVMAPNCTPDGSPLRTSQAAAVLAAYRHLATVVDVMAPERRAGLLRNLASATAHLDPHVVMQVLGSHETAGAEGMDLRRAVADAMDDDQVAHLLATTLAIDGQATDRLAAVFGTIAPDDERKRRVLRMARTLLTESSFGRQAAFEALWTSTEALLLSYNERPFVSEAYRASLDQVGARAEAMAGDVPAELAALVGTLDQENVRRLSVTLLIDLLSLESDRARAADLAHDVAAFGEDLMLAGDYEGTREVVRALGRHARDTNGIASEGCRVALDGLVNTVAFHEAVDCLQDMDDGTAAVFQDLCEAIGPGCVDVLVRPLEIEEPTRARVRASAIVKALGRRAVKRLAPLAASAHWHAQRNAAELLGEIGSAEGVPLLQPLLRGHDPRVTRAAARALSNIDDPAAARSVHTALRAAAGELRRAVVDALVEERDPRVVPLLVRILDESDALGADHDVVLETLGAVGLLGSDAAIPAVDRVMRTTRWFARPKLRAVKTASVNALKQIGTPAADAAITRAALSGDRLLKRVAARSGRPS